MTMPPNPFDGLAELQRSLAEALRPYQEMHERLTQTLRQVDLKPVAEALRPYHEMCEQLAQTLKQADVTPYINLIKQAHEFIENAKSTYAPAIASFVEVIARIAIAQKKRQLLDESGWLPHATLPTSLIDQCGEDADQLSRSIAQYYAENWPKVRSELSCRISRFRVDEESKETFREALAAYDQKLYRSVCRLLMPEIERVARIELNDGTLGKVVGKDGKTTKIQDVLQKLAGELSLDDIEPSSYLGMTLFIRLTEHLYAQVHTEEERKRMEADPVPNRHAAVHGLVSYRTAQNALNTIFMTDFIFQVVTAVRSLPETRTPTVVPGRYRV
jgi:hypothetical protein